MAFKGPIFRHELQGRKATHVQPKPVLIDLNQPGRLRTCHVLTLCGISDSTLYARVKAGTFPPPDGKDGDRKYWNTKTIRDYLLPHDQQALESTPINRHNTK
jgi:predicted DNA-binding transcriptional regulator AlpA